MTSENLPHKNDGQTPESFRFGWTLSFVDWIIAQQSFLWWIDAFSAFLHSNGVPFKGTFIKSCVDFQFCHRHLFSGIIDTDEMLPDVWRCMRNCILAYGSSHLTLSYPYCSERFLLFSTPRECRHLHVTCILLVRPAFLPNLLTCWYTPETRKTD